jgi:AraC family transcriptional regulator of adaptative response/methylated-DNA-[protein]-cysteine methyltransferase
VCNFSFLDDQAPQAPLTALAQRWPEAELRGAITHPGVIHTMFDGSKAPDRPISLHVSGTNFQISVWRALLQIRPPRW